MGRGTGSPRVFVSSTTGALDEYRNAAVSVCRRLGLTVIAMEEFVAERPPPVGVCRRKVDECDIFILLVAHRYGDRPPGEKKSYTELEYDWALARTEMPLLPFVVDPNHPWPPPDIDREPRDVEALQRFVERLADHHVRRFGDIHTFREDLFLALKDAADQFEDGGDEDEPADRRLPDPPAFVAAPPYTGSAPFTGRADALAELDAWARTDDPMMVLEAVGGTGKSALTWEWAERRAPEVVPDLAGRFWWSFYEGSASMRSFLTELLAYLRRRPLREVAQLSRADLASDVLSELRRRPYLIVLDGFERLLAAYHRFDPTKMREDEVEPVKRALIEPDADLVLRDLVSAGPSKVLLSTRLFPEAVERYRRPLPGVRHHRLPGLSDADTALLLRRLGVRGEGEATARFFRRLGNHPLLIGIVAGLVRDYRRRPGDIDRWLEDPLAGGHLSLAELDLTQRRHHILEAALGGLAPEHARVLGWLSVFTGAVHWSTLESINPLKPDPPADASQVPSRPSETAYLTRRLQERSRAAEKRRAQWEASPEAKRAGARLAAALEDLEDRGVLWWNRDANTYDLHPIVRAYAFDQLQEGDRRKANERVHAHFEALPAEDVDAANSVEDLDRTITIFRALVGSGRFMDASMLWERRLFHGLYVRFAAYTTVIELLTPLRDVGSPHARGDLAGALAYSQRYDDATHIETLLLDENLENGVAESVAISLSNLCGHFLGSGTLRAASRCIDFVTALNSAAPQDPGSLALRCAELAAQTGETGSARRALDDAERRGTRLKFPWFAGDVHIVRLELDFEEGTLAEDHLAEAERLFTLWSHRRSLVSLRRELLIRKRDFVGALEVQHEDERLQRNAGVPVETAATAFLLTQVGRPDDAVAVIDDTIATLSARHPARRPHYRLAQALMALGRLDEARTQALEAYRQAWADGPPYAFHWRLRDARQLLEELELDEPELPTVDPAGVKIPHEDKVRAFIAELAA